MYNILLTACLIVTFNYILCSYRYNNIVIVVYNKFLIICDYY